MKKIGTKKLETERLILRKSTLEDADSMFKNWGSDPLVTRYVTWKTHETIEDSLEYLKYIQKEYQEGNAYHWLIVLKENNTPIGTIDVVRILTDGVVEIGYNIGSLWWGNGYTTEALKKVIEFLFNEVDVDTICARHLVENPASGKVMQKAGLKLEGILCQREICNYTNTLMDVAYYSILKDEYKNKKTSN